MKRGGQVEKPASPAKRNQGISWPKFSDLDQKTLAAFLDQFGLMLQCGLQPSTALDALSANQPSRKLCEVIDDISRKIHTGHTLTEAMSRHPDVFPGTVLVLVRVGEQSGDLAGQLRRAGEMISRTNTFLAKVKGAITGPLVTAGFCGLILFMIVKLVFPRFVEMYDSMDIEFPALSRLVLSFVSVVNHPITLILFFGLIGFCVIKRQKVQEWVLDFLLFFPPTRPVLGSMLCATTCEALSTLHAQGVPLHRALTLIADSAPYKAHKAHLQNCKKALVITGSPGWYRLFSSFLSRYGCHRGRDRCTGCAVAVLSENAGGRDRGVSGQDRERTGTGGHGGHGSGHGHPFYRNVSPYLRGVE